MKTYLLPQSGNFYKANLHCHSTISDGRWTVEEIKKNYMERGYSIVAYTDHGVFVNHNDLAEEGFLPINGFEIDISNNEPWGCSDFRTCHMCLLSLDREKTVQKIVYDSKHLFKNMEITHLEEGAEIKHFDYEPEVVNSIIKQARDDGFFVTYNHPVWSLETKDEYGKYYGMNALEIINYGCICMGFDDINAHQYDDILRSGQRIFCVGADDNHDANPIGSPRNDSFGGFTMIKADKLEYSTISDALLAGNFYASEGPEIKELWFEDGYVHVTCSDAAKITYNTAAIRAKAAFPENGEPLTSAAFTVRDVDKYFRITVYGKDGKRAFTRAYYLDEIPADRA